MKMKKLLVLVVALALTTGILSSCCCICPSDEDVYEEIFEELFDYWCWYLNRLVIVLRIFACANFCVCIGVQSSSIWVDRCFTLIKAVALPFGYWAAAFILFYAKNPIAVIAMKQTPDVMVHIIVGRWVKEDLSCCPICFISKVGRVDLSLPSLILSALVLKNFAHSLQKSTVQISHTTTTVIMRRRLFCDDKKYLATLVCTKSA